MLLDVLPLDGEVGDHRGHLFIGLHLEHADVLVLLLAPLSQCSLHTVLAVDSEHLSGLLPLSLCVVGCALVLVNHDEGLGHGCLVHRRGQDLAAAATSARILSPALEQVGNLRCVIVLLILED